MEAENFQQLISLDDICMHQILSQCSRLCCCFRHKRNLVNLYAADFNGVVLVQNYLNRTGREEWARQVSYLTPYLFWYRSFFFPLPFFIMGNMLVLKFMFFGFCKRIVDTRNYLSSYNLENLMPCPAASCILSYVYLSWLAFASLVYYQELHLGSFPTYNMQLNIIK